MSSYSSSIRPHRITPFTSFNDGVPIHVVQRYLGHKSPEMTLRYANWPRPPRPNSSRKRWAPTESTSRSAPPTSCT
jgi:hypothetical protein